MVDRISVQEAGELNYVSPPSWVEEGDAYPLFFIVDRQTSQELVLNVSRLLDLTTVKVDLPAAEHPTDTPGGVGHGVLGGLVAPADDHTQYALLAGRAGGQGLVGGTGAGENLDLQSTFAGGGGAVSVRLAGTGPADIGPEFRVQQDQTGAGGWANVLTVIAAGGMVSGIGGLALGNMLDLMNEGDGAPEMGGVGGQYHDWVGTPYSQPADDSRNYGYLISPRDKAFYLWNLHDHGTAEEWLAARWVADVARLEVLASGAGTLRALAQAAKGLERTPEGGPKAEAGPSEQGPGEGPHPDDRVSG